MKKSIFVGLVFSIVFFALSNFVFSANNGTIKVVAPPLDCGGSCTAAKFNSYQSGIKQSASGLVSDPQNYDVSVSYGSNNDFTAQVTHPDGSVQNFSTTTTPSGQTQWTETNKVVPSGSTSSTSGNPTSGSNVSPSQGVSPVSPELVAEAKNLPPLNVWNSDANGMITSCPTCHQELQAIAKAAGLEGMTDQQIVDALKGAGAPITQDPTKNGGANPNTGKALSKEEIDKYAQVLKKLKQVNCGVTAPGQSSANGKMWGEHEVARPEQGEGADPRPTKDKCISQYGILAVTANPGLCAQDIQSWEPSNTKGVFEHIATIRVTSLNWWFFKENSTKQPLGVTSNADFEKLEEKGKLDPKAGGVAIGGKSNEQDAMDKMKGANIYTPKSIQEHKEYKDKWMKPKNGFTPLNGSSARVKPGAYRERTGYSADVPDENTATLKDMRVTDDCKYMKDPTAGQQQQQKPNGFPNNVGGNNGGGGGSPGGGQGGGMPQIPQIPQGGGGQPQNSGQPQPGNPSGQPGQPQVMPDGTSCPTEYSPVCGKDGKTYPNLCFAQHSGSTPVEVDHQGACETTNSTASLFEQLNEIVTELVSSGVPESLITSVIEVISTLISDIFSGVADLTPTTI